MSVEVIGRKPRGDAAHHPFRSTAIITGIFVIVGLSFLAWVHARFGTIHTALGVLNGQVLVPDGFLRTFGPLKPGEKVEVVFNVRNFGGEPVRLVGGNSVCVCTMPEDLPITIPPGAVKPVRITIKAPKDPQRLDYPVTIYSTHPDQPRLMLAVSGEVR